MIVLADFDKEERKHRTGRAFQDALALYGSIGGVFCCGCSDPIYPGLPIDQQPLRLFSADLMSVIPSQLNPAGLFYSS